MSAPSSPAAVSMPDDVGRASALGEQRTTTHGAPLPAAGDSHETALSWLLEQWLSDVDPDWATHVLDGLRAEDPDIFDTLDAVNVADAGRGLL